MSSRERKDRMFDAFAAIGKALASGRRIELLDVLAQGPRSVEHLASEIHQSMANTSSHLRVLAGAGLVATKRSGNRVVYSLADEDVEGLLAAMRVAAEAHVAALDRLAAEYLGARDGVELVSRTELAERLGGANRPLVIDVRPHAEYAAGHIPGALSVPPALLASRLDDLPSDAEVVAYCRGSYCVYADDAVRSLHRRRLRARRLEDGFPEWRRARLPVSVGPERNGVERNGVERNGVERNGVER